MDTAFPVPISALHVGDSPGHLDGRYGSRFHSDMSELWLEITEMTAAPSANPRAGDAGLRLAVYPGSTVRRA